MEYLKEFRKFIEAEQRLERTSIDAYVRDLGGFLDYAAGSGEWFSGALAEGYLRHLRDEGRRPSTLRRVRMSIRRFYHWLVWKKLMRPEALEMIDPIRHEWENLPVLRRDEVDEMIAACGGRAAERNRTIIRLMYETGMRVSEVCGLDVGSVVSLGGVKALRARVKGGSDRVIPISGECFKALQDYVGRWRNRYAVGTALFVDLKGRRVKRRRVSAVISRLAQRLGLAKSSAHTLRRSRATALLESGVDVQDVQRFLGHESIEATEHYLVTSPEKMREVYDRCFAPLTGGPRSA
ncbi:MAG: tyrosine recombinase XerC [Phycisphaerae bacterium]